MPERMPFTLIVLIIVCIAPGDMFPSTLIMYATRPATWGVAMDVPDIVLTLLSDPIQALVIRSPGAKTSTTEP